MSGQIPQGTTMMSWKIQGLQYVSGKKMENLQKSGKYTETAQNNFLYIFIIGNNAFSDQSSH